MLSRSLVDTDTCTRVGYMIMWLSIERRHCLHKSLVSFEQVTQIAFRFQAKGYGMLPVHVVSWKDEGQRRGVQVQS